MGLLTKAYRFKSNTPEPVLPVPDEVNPAEKIKAELNPESAIQKKN